MTESTKTTEQSQASSSQPWAEAMPLVNSLFAGYGSTNAGVTGGQTNALANLTNSVSNIPNFGGYGSEAIKNLFNTDNSGQVGMLNTAYDTLKTNLTPTASGAHLDPYSTPGFRDAIETMINDTTNKTKGVYAGSGRDPSGAGSFAGSLGRGITSGVAPTIANQYNTNFQNMTAANRDLFSGAGSTSSAINNLLQQERSNGVAGITAAGALPGLYSSPAMAQYAAANAQYAQPFQNLAQLLQPGVALAGLGQNSTGTGTSTQTNNPSWLDSISQGMKVGGQGLSGMASLFALSDERVKENKSRVGALYDGTPVWSYNYIGDETPRMGVMAQEVERRHPGDVVDLGGVKVVNYANVARRAARVGALAEAA